MQADPGAKYREWRTAPERDQLARAIELFKSDPSAAVEQLERLAESESEVARWMAKTHLASAYCRGDALGKPDYLKAEDWYLRAAADGYKTAEFELGKMLRKSGQYERALDVFKRSAAIGWSPSMRLIGLMYANGEGVVRDLGQARRWWERSIERGNVLAKRYLAFAMMRGQFGWANVFVGPFLFLSAFVDVFHVVLTSSEGDPRLR